MRFLIHIVVVFALWIVQGPKAFSQGVEYVQLLKYTQQQGLSSYNIRKIAQDKYGFLWVATQEGVSRFDGKEFVNYNYTTESPKRRLNGSDIRDLIVDSSGNKIWVLCNEGGINAIDLLTGTVVHRIKKQNEEVDNWNISFQLVNNKLYIGSFSGLSIYDINQGRYLPLKFELPNKRNIPDYLEGRYVERDAFNNVWVCFSGYGIVIIDSKTDQVVKHLPSNLFTGNKSEDIVVFFSGVEMTQGTKLFATSKGVRQISYTSRYDVQIENAPMRLVPALNKRFINCIGKYGSRVIISGDNLYSFNKELDSVQVLKEYSRNMYDWLSQVYCSYTDMQDNLWLGCKMGIALLNRNSKAFKTFAYDPATGVKLEHQFAIDAFDNNEVLCATKNGLFLIINNSRAIKIAAEGFYQNLSKLSDSETIVSGEMGLQIYFDRQLFDIERIYPEFAPYSKWNVNSVVQYADSIYILGTENYNGILVWDRIRRKISNIHQASIPLRLSANIVNTVCKMKDQKVFVLSDLSITVLGDDLKVGKNLFLTNPQTDEKLGILMDICETSNYYWIAAYGNGIVQLDKQMRMVAMFNTLDGLCNNGVYKLFPYKDSLIFITTNNGLSVFNTKRKFFRNYFLENGLHSNAFEEACGMIYKGNYYAGGVDGYTIISPDKLLPNQTPPITYFRYLVIEAQGNHKADTSNVGSETFFIPHNYTQATIHFSGINYRSPEHTMFKYKINELHSNWIDIGSQNFIPLIGISPGSYHLQMQAFNEDNIPSEIKTLTLIFLPKWYQTWWFRTIIVLVLMGLLYGLYRYRLAQVKKEQQIRQRIAGDLHDDIGSTLNSIKVFTNLAMMKPENNLTYLQQLKEGVQSAIVGVRDMVWVLDDKQDTLGHLLSRIEQFIHPLASAQGISFESYLDPTLADRILKKEEKRNLYLILKEALNNSIKYAEASVLQLRIEKSAHDKYIILVRDNGKGFDVNTVQKGNGLHNLQYRAQQIRYDIEVRTAPAQGTAIVLTRP